MSNLLTWHALLAMLIGVASGVLSALAGVGGAVVSTPGIRVLGASPLVAVGSTVPAIIPAAITGSIRYSRAGLIDWRVGIWCGSVGMFSAMAGAIASDHVDGTLLMVLTAGLVLWSSTSVLRRREPLVDASPSTGPSVPTRAPFVVLVPLGLAAGFVAGLLGVGGGILLVPSFGRFLHMPLKRTIATSLVAVAAMSVSSLIGHIAEGHVRWEFALPLMVGVVPGARLGSKIGIHVSDTTMRHLCGGLLLVIGAVYLASELARAI